MSLFKRLFIRKFPQNIRYYSSVSTPYKPKSTVNVSNMDVGGTSITIDPIKSHPKDRYLSDYEKKIDGLVFTLMYAGYMIPDDLRSIWEQLSINSLLKYSYYDKWCWSCAIYCLKNKLINETKLVKYINNKLNNDKYFIKLFDNKDRYKYGDNVMVRGVGELPVNWRYLANEIITQHTRVPGYIHNQIGKVVEYVGDYRNPEWDVHRIEFDYKIPLYRVMFNRKDVIIGDNSDDTITVDIPSHWLKLIVDTNTHTHDGHTHEHNHQNRDTIEQNAIKQEPTSNLYQIICDGMMEQLIEDGIIEQKNIRAYIEQLDAMQQKNYGSEIVFKLWTDKSFKNDIDNIVKNKDNLNEYLTKYGFNTNIGEPCEVRLLENDINTHNVITCTLCSCYPRNLLGIPPDWYKSMRYRSEIIRDARSLLKNEFDCDIDDNIKINVADSTNELRYMVIPHPSQLWKNWQEKQEQLSSNLDDREKQSLLDEFQKICTRDILIGTKRYAY